IGSGGVCEEACGLQALCCFIEQISGSGKVVISHIYSACMSKMLLTVNCWLLTKIMLSEQLTV
ncbi:hypothetical protein, partial [Microcoleus sp. Pol12B4]|uniref:hypothetical protein n=1 Tax=Microcoleus sp. Pol12B4 TaxID=3055395 RepID=UPI002FD60904